MTANIFNTSRPAGQVLVSFTASAANGNSAAFNISTLTPGKRYLVNVSGVMVDNPVADAEGKIQFSYSQWPAGMFTVTKNSIGKSTGTVRKIDQTPVSGANVSMFTAGGAHIGSGQSGVDGRFEFTNVSTGSYYVVVNKELYGQNQSSVFNINANATADVGSLTLWYLDVNGDGEINVLDLQKIFENLSGDGQILNPICDVNGDGSVDVLDANDVAQNIR